VEADTHSDDSKDKTDRIIMVVRIKNNTISENWL
jgi:hypothetical protein